MLKQGYSKNFIFIEMEVTVNISYEMIHSVNIDLAPQKLKNCFCKFYGLQAMPQSFGEYQLAI